LPGVCGEGGERPDGEADGEDLPHGQPAAPAPGHVTQREHNRQEPTPQNVTQSAGAYVTK